jgi:hypothetical protein
LGDRRYLGFFEEQLEWLEKAISEAALKNAWLAYAA